MTADTRVAKRLVWFCMGIDYVAQQPDVLKRLRDEIGLTTIMPESPICHTSGFAASQELAQRGPFEDWRTRAHLYPNIKEGIYPPVAGIISGFDDGPLLRLIEAAKAADIEVWGHLGLWSYGGDVYPEYAMRDLDGAPLDEAYKAWGIGLCPSRDGINQWTRDGLVEAVGRYAIDGFCVDHARYPAPANVHSLSACGCEACVAAATALGWDFAQVKAGVKAFGRALAALDRGRVRRLLAASPGLWDFVMALEGGPQVLEWLRLRAALLAAPMDMFRRAVQEAGGVEKVFGCDVFPPSIALLGGHDYGTWPADYLTGGSSFGGVVGWATGVTNLAGEWAPALCRTVGLEENEALELVYRLFGYTDLELPDSVQGLAQGPLPLAQLYRREVDKLQAWTGGGFPLYPPISAGAESSLVGRFCDAVVEGGCDGAMASFGGSDEGVDQVCAGPLRHLVGRLG